MGGLAEGKRIIKQHGKAVANIEIRITVVELTDLRGNDAVACGSDGIVGGVVQAVGPSVVGIEAEIVGEAVNNGGLKRVVAGVTLGDKFGDGLEDTRWQTEGQLDRPRVAQG